MKKIIALLLVIMMCLSFVACDESEDTKTPLGGEITENNGGSTSDNTTNENNSTNDTENTENNSGSTSDNTTNENNSTNDTENTENNGGSTSDNTTNENNSTNDTENNDDSTKEDSTTSDTVNPIDPIDPNSPEGRAIADLDKVKGYFTAHFANNEKWYPVENDTNNWVEMTADGKFQCMYMGQPSTYWNFAWILESCKTEFGVEGTFSYVGDDVIYTLADESASATWKDIDAFDADAYQQSDEYKEIVKQATIASMKQELKDFYYMIQLELIISNNNFEISSGIFISMDENGNLTSSVGTIADAFNSYDEMNFIGTFAMDGDTLVYINNEDNTISVTWDEAVN